uniref:Uncharacterized protein n=1 Tax=Chromera velia CCMP2878 TaxID=1169474 RepID=A0A0G4IBI8_9ALVE|eukprot:Cvel_12868.t1-p1 / transcript=Cvel_12868.t1 / gene=Cvel_12868 / organism=Chromera_velia_CCMP2878 / gene_product=hypothetical protein / transcript_product=hypothetical protein / location=Cvel_scaffold859:11835-13104(-) / protein_length=282 / sequence_SO=supercontig / SO=protein_coding / is_pseudo=false
MQTGKAHRGKSIPAAWLQPVGGGSGKWRPEGIAPRPISKQQVLRYFDFIDGHLPPVIETQVSHDAPPISVALPGQVQEGENGNENEGVQPATDEALSDRIPPDDSLFGSDLLRNQDNQVVGGEDGKSGERSGEGSMFVGDVKGAFLQSDDTNRDRVYTRMPEWMPPIPDVCPYPDMPAEKWERIVAYARSLQPGQVREVVRGLYGIPVSSKLFDDKWVRAIEKVEYKRVELGIAIDRGKNVFINWIDDVFGLIAFGQVDGLVKHLRGEMQFGKLSRLDMGAY